MICRIGIACLPALLSRQDGPTYEQQIRDGFLPVWQGRVDRGLRLL